MCVRGWKVKNDGKKHEIRLMTLPTQQFSFNFLFFSVGEINNHSPIYREQNPTNK